MTVISGVLIGPYGEALPGVTIEMVAVRTTATVLEQASSRFVTDTNGRYSLKVEPGRYNVMVSASGQPAARVGSIIVEITSSTGTLNDFLTKPGEEDLTPEIVKTVDRMRAEAANSAAVAKVSENNSVAAMANALSKVVTAEQTVASAVKFNNGITSLGDCVLQSKTPGANVIIRFKDNDAVEQGALYNTVATGQMTLRWGGVAYSVLFKPDGTVTFPANAFIGTARVMTEATQLSNKNLNDVRAEGPYFQNATSNATVANNYPAGLAGTLHVIDSHAQASGRTGITQLYYPWNVGNYFYSRVYLALSDTWSDWDIYEARTKSDARYLQIGAYGLGADFRPSLTGYTLASDYRINGAFYANVSSMTDTFDGGNNHVLNVFGYSNRTYGFQIAFPFGVDKMAFRRIQNNGVGAWKEVWSTANTTVDSNGFLKKASPIVKLFGDGSSELNEESLGVTTERIGQGVYRVSGVLGFNGDGAWGGHGNGIEIPVDDNKRALIWVESKVLPDGDIEVRTYHRTYDTGPYSARNIEAMDSGDVDQKNIPIFVEMPDGTPVDIPAGRFIDLRVEMPTVDEPEPKLEPEPGPEIESELGAEPEPAVSTESLVPELTPEPGVDPEPSPAVGEEGVEQDRPVSERKPIF